MIRYLTLDTKTNELSFVELDMCPVMTSKPYFTVYQDNGHTYLQPESMASVKSFTTRLEEKYGWFAFLETNQNSPYYGCIKLPQEAEMVIELLQL